MKTIKPGAKLSTMWDEFQVVREKGILQPAVQCRRCSKVLTYKEKTNGNRNLSRHLETCGMEDRSSQKKLDPPPGAKKQIIPATVTFCALGLRAPESVADPGLIQFAQKLLDLGYMYAKYGRLDAEKLLPHPTTIADYIKKFSDVARQHTVKEVLPAIKQYRCGATVDCWTDPNSQDHFVVMTSHLLQEWLGANRLLFARALPRGMASTGDKLRTFIENVLKDLGIDPSLLGRIKFTTDNGADVKKALELIIRFYCITHALNICLRTTMSVNYATVLEAAVAKSPEAQLIVEKGNEWVKALRAILPESDHLRRKGVLKASNFVTQGHLPMLKNIIDFKQEVCNVCPMK